MRSCNEEWLFRSTQSEGGSGGQPAATCLSPAQINAIKKVKEGPRNSLGHTIKSPAGGVVKDHADNTVRGYAYDGGYMTSSGIPSRRIGTPPSTPGDFLCLPVRLPCTEPGVANVALPIATRGC
jgi:hypothetical protein